MSLEILLSGSTGKVGRVIEELVSADEELEIVARASTAQFFEAIAVRRRTRRLLPSRTLP